MHEVSILSNLARTYRKKVYGAEPIGGEIVTHFRYIGIGELYGNFME